VEHSALLAIVVGALSLSAPLILAAMGGLVSERSGVMNIALEGKALTAACLAAVVGSALDSPLVGLLAAVLGAVLLSLLHCLLTQAYRVDHIVSGMAINLIALGGTSYLDRRFTDQARSAEIPQLPLAIHVVLALVLPFAVAAFLRWTRGGLRLLAVGNAPDKSRQMGVDPLRVRYAALAWAGVFCGLAGALIVTNAGRFTDGMTAGRGFIALAALIVGSWRPLPALLACLAFGTLEALQIHFQGAGGLPSEVWNSVPYVATVAVLAGLVGRSRAPAGLGKP
jgi:simple sugar transport system permease protein